MKTLQKSHPLCPLVSPLSNRQVCGRHTTPVPPPWATWKLLWSPPPPLCALQEAVGRPPLPHTSREPLAGQLSPVTTRTSAQGRRGPSTPAPRSGPYKGSQGLSWPETTQSLRLGP